MEPFRFTLGRRLGVAPGWSALRRAWAAADGRRRRWLTALAGAALTAIMAGWPAMLAGPNASQTAGPSAAGPGVVPAALHVDEALGNTSPPNLPSPDGGERPAWPSRA